MGPDGDLWPEDPEKGVKDTDKVHADIDAIPVGTTTWDGLWAALVEKARNPAKFKMDVSDVVVADRPGYLARSMAINPTGEHVEEHL